MSRNNHPRRSLPGSKNRLVAALFLAPAIALGGTLTAQSIGLETKVFGKPSGVPATAVNSISICATETSTGKMKLSLSGGSAGKTAGIAIGLAKANVPLYGATLLVRPDVVLFMPFDAQGEVNLTFPIPNRPGVRVYIQGAHVDPINPSALFAMSSGLDLQIVKKQPISMAFDLKTAELLMELSHDAYEYPVSHEPWARPRLGELSVNKTIAGGFKVLAKIQSPNPTSEPFFKKISWPDTQVFVARNASGDIAVIFPGTVFSIRDFATSLQLGQVDGFHKGYRLAYLSIHSKLEAKLKEVVDGKARVYITGHSLGGGLAAIAAHTLQPTLECLGVRTENIVLYAFGCSRAMNSTRAAELGKRVPHHYAVVNKDDLCTHTPTASSGYEHIPNMRVFYPSHLVRNPLAKPWVSTRGTMFAESGSQYKSEPIGGLAPGIFYGHYQDEYTDRIRGVLPAPKVWLTVSSAGDMVLNWSFPERATHGFGLDFIALYKGDPHKAGPGGHLLLQFKLAPATGSWVTGTPKGPDFHIGYVQGYLGTFDQKFLATSGPYTWSKPSVWLDKSTGLVPFVRLNWAIKDPGRFDYVALYNKDPWTAGPNGHLLGQFQWAVNGTGWTSLRLWGAGYYVAYIEKDSLLGQGNVVAVSGPTR